MPQEIDDINAWTFGIITNGKKMDQLQKILESIRALEIPQYTIIICGTYPGTIEKDMQYIQFTKKDNKGWITKKKNLIAEASPYENMVIIHDRIFFTKNWFKGMKKYGNDFDVLSCKISYQGRRAYDWITTLYPYDDVRSTWFQGGYLDYKADDAWTYLDGGLIIMKKSVWKKAKWDETLFWNDREDVKLSTDQHRKGIRIAFNPYSSCKTLSFNHPLSKLYFTKNKQGKLIMKGPWYLRLGKKGLYLKFFIPYALNQWMKGKPLDFKLKK